MLGNRVKEFRAERGWGISELSRRSGVSIKHICEIESQETLFRLGWQQMRGICKAFGLPPCEVFPDAKKGV